MKHLIPLAAAALLIAGCNGRTKELEQQNAALQQQNKELAATMTAQDAYIDEVVTAVNDVSQSIEAARATEKNLLSESKGIEGAPTRTKEQVRADLLGRIATVNTSIQENYRKVADLQKRISSSRKQHASLQAMVDNLRKNLEEREQAIGLLENRIRGLEGEVAEKTEMVRQRDMVIDAQKREIATVYYVIGTKRELEEKGIVKEEGGFLWGLIGSTTTLAPGFDPSWFTPIDKDRSTSFRMDSRIREILPKRSPEYYSEVRGEDGGSVLTISDLNKFWKDRYLVILTD